MSVESYLTLKTTLRPPRVACLVNINENDWQERIQIAIESFTQTWGGSYFIIVPTDGNTISQLFWEILSAYDPDYFWTAFRSNDRDEEEFELSLDLIEQITNKIAPFHYFPSNFDIENHPIKNNFLIKGSSYPNFTAKYPFTDISKILPYCEHLDRFVEVPNLSGMMKLWASTVLGSFGEKTKEKIYEAKVEPVDLNPFEFQKTIFNTVVDGIFGNLVINTEAFPFFFSSIQLAFARSTEFPESNELTIVVIGENLEDFCLYFCLSRMRRKVAWLLPEWVPQSTSADDYKQWYEGPLDHFVDALKNLASKLQGNGNICFVSLSLSENRISEIRELFNNSPRRLHIQENLPVDVTGERREPDFNKHISKALKFLLRFPIRLYGLGNTQKPSSQPVLNSKIAGFLEPPVPKNFSYVDPFEHLWLTEISVENYHFPRNPLLGTEIIKGGVYSSWDARTGKDGLVCFSPRSGFVNSDIEQILQPFSIDIPNAITIFTRIFNHLKFRAEISDKGRFGLTTISKFRGISATADFLLASGKRAILEKYTSEKSNKPSNDSVTETEGMFLKSDSRWYLDFRAIDKFIENEGRTSQLIYELLGKNIFYRGLILKCFACRNTDWFSISDITRSYLINGRAKFEIWHDAKN